MTFIKKYWFPLMLVLFFIVFLIFGGWKAFLSESEKDEQLRKAREAKKAKADTAGIQDAEVVEPSTAVV